MLLNFQRAFARDVWTGKKRQTIRAAGRRVDVPAVGNLAHCYTGLRTTNTVLLGRWPLVRVDTFRFNLTVNGMEDVLLAGKRMTTPEFEALARADGFEDGAAMDYWFECNHLGGPFSGWVLGWEWSAPAEPLEALEQALARKAVKA